MNIDVNKIMGLLQETLLKELGNEVELIFRYGSTMKGNTHTYSDLDISYVPVHETTWNSITVLIDEVMVDFYPIHWSRLDAIAEFDDMSGTLLSSAEVIYSRDESAAERFRALSDTLVSWQAPDKRPDMLRKAMALFTKATEQYFLLDDLNKANSEACMFHARNIHTQVLHCLAVCNQKSIDTRKREQVYGLPLLPDNFAEQSETIINSTDGGKLAEACKDLLSGIRGLLVAEQRKILSTDISIRDSLDAAYPELKGDLQHVKLACDRGDFFHMPLLSLLHELQIHFSKAADGVDYADFNNLADYQKDLKAMGFPDLLEAVASKDYDGLSTLCDVFDERLQEFLRKHDVPLNSFADLDEFKKYLKDRNITV